MSGKERFKMIYNEIWTKGIESPEECVLQVCDNDTGLCRIIFDLEDAETDCFCE